MHPNSIVDDDEEIRPRCQKCKALLPRSRAGRKWCSYACSRAAQRARQKAAKQAETEQ